MSVFISIPRHLSSPLIGRFLRGEADGAAFQTHLQTVGRAAAVLQYPTIQHGLTRLLSAGRLPRRLHAAAAAAHGLAASGPAHSAGETLPQSRTHGQELAEETGQDTVSATVISSDLPNVGGVRLEGGVAFGGGEPVVIGAVMMIVMMMVMMMVRKAAALSFTGGRPKRRRRRRRSGGR